MDSLPIAPEPQPHQPDSPESSAQQLSPTSIPPAWQTAYPQDNPPWGWVEILIFVVVTLVLYFGVTMVLAIAYVALGHPASDLKAESKPVVWIALSCTVLVSIGQMLYLYFRTKSYGQRSFWRGLGWISFESLGYRTQIASTLCVIGGVAVGLFMSTASNLIGQKHGSPMEKFLSDRHTALVLGLLGIFLAPLVEETVFRGFIYPVARRSFGMVSGVLLTGVLFGLLHSPQLWGNWAQIGLLVLVGIIFTYVRAATKTTLASFLLHLSYNSFIFTSFFIATHGLKTIPLH